MIVLIARIINYESTFCHGVAHQMVCCLLVGNGSQVTMMSLKLVLTTLLVFAFVGSHGVVELDK